MSPLLWWKSLVVEFFYFAALFYVVTSALGCVARARFARPPPLCVIPVRRASRALCPWRCLVRNPSRLHFSSIFPESVSVGTFFWISRHFPWIRFSRYFILNFPPITLNQVQLVFHFEFPANYTESSLVGISIWISRHFPWIRFSRYFILNFPPITLNQVQLVFHFEFPAIFPESGSVGI